MSPAISMATPSIPTGCPGQVHDAVDVTTPLRCGPVGGVAFAVRSGAAQSVEQGVQVADHGHEERVLNADAVGDYSLNEGQNRTADDGHVQNAGSSSCQ